MRAEQQNLSESAQVDQQSIQPFPRSQKIYVQGSRPDIRVPMREISLDVTPTDFGGEINAPVLVYDTSGPYTDPTVTIDVRKGLGDVRSAWIGVAFVAAGLGLAVWPYLRGRSEPSSRDAEPADPAT